MLKNFNLVALLIGLKYLFRTQMRSIHGVRNTEVCWMIPATVQRTYPIPEFPLEIDSPRSWGMDKPGESSEGMITFLELAWSSSMTPQDMDLMHLVFPERSKHGVSKPRRTSSPPRHGARGAVQTRHAQPPSDLEP